MPDDREETFLPFKVARHAVPLASQFRTTWLASSHRSLRDRGLLDRYFAALSPEYRDVIRGAIAGAWLPIDACVAHYEACDRLHLGAADIVQVGREAAAHVHASSLSAVVRLARRESATPWEAYGQLRRMWERVWLGGGVSVVKVDAQEARIEIAGWPPSRVPYCRIALRGVLLGITELFCTKAYAKDVDELCTARSLGYRVHWA